MPPLKTPYQFTVQHIFVAMSASACAFAMIHYFGIQAVIGGSVMGGLEGIIIGSAVGTVKQGVTKENRNNIYTKRGAYIGLVLGAFVLPPFTHFLVFPDLAAAAFLVLVISTGVLATIGMFHRY